MRKPVVISSLFAASVLTLLCQTEILASGSMNFSVGQRFFKDERLGNKNGFRDGFVPEFAVDFGVYQLPYGFQPVVGASYIYNNARDCAVNADGDCISSNTTDRFKYHLFGGSVGMRWRAWEPDFFLVSPYLLGAFTYNFILIRRNSLGAEVKKRVKGGEFGGELQAGILTSFMYSKDRKVEMEREWEIRDFGLSLFGRYVPRGLFQHGMADIIETGGWGFAAGLYLEW